MKLVKLFLVFFPLISFAQQSGDYQIAVLKYNGGGDYYANPTSLPNLVTFCNTNYNTKINKETPYVEASSSALFMFPFVHMTGHGNVIFSNAEIENLRTYFKGGGFLHIDDNYGMDKFIRLEIQKLFPDNKMVEIPFSHPIFNYPNKFPNGLPKIHEHDGKRPQAFGIFEDGRLCLLYTYECDLGDGWEDQEVHNDSPAKHEAALKMGANILFFALMKGGYE